MPYISTHTQYKNLINVPARTFLLPGSTIDQVLWAAPFSSLAVPSGIHLIYHGFLSAQILLGYFHLAGLFMSVDNLSN